MFFILIFEGFVYTLVGIGFLSFLGFTYDSYISVIIFLAVCYIILLPVNYYISILVGLFKAKSNISYFQQQIIDFILYAAFSSLVIGGVDFFMKGIHITPANQILFIILCYLFQTYSDFIILIKK